MRTSFADFSQRCIAHRGLHDNTGDHPENTLASFERAVEAGFAIELDIRLTRDDQVVVTHDEDLQRTCGSKAIVRAVTYEELRGCRVYGSDQGIPLFTEALELIGGQVPLVIDVKPEIDALTTCRIADRALRDYPGPFCVQSFDPRVLLWFRTHNPSVLRGQLSGDIGRETGSGVPIVDATLNSMALNALTWPDFIGYNWLDAARPVLHWWRRVLKCPLVAWTIRSQAQLDAARHSFDAFIFEGFTPRSLSRNSAL